jgi:hypothetical protein
VFWVRRVRALDRLEGEGTRAKRAACCAQHAITTHPTTLALPLSALDTRSCAGFAVFATLMDMFMHRMG